jgi:basic membrane protein A
MTSALANAQIAAGADVIYHASGSTGHGVFEAAHDAHALAIGVDADQYDEMPGTVVTSMIKRGDVAVFDAVREVIEHRFVAGMRVFGLREAGVDYVHEGPHAAGIPDDVKARVEELRADVVAGRVAVPSR